MYSVHIIAYTFLPSNMHVLIIFKFIINSGQIIPIHKKGNKTSKENYRPVTLLVTINKVFERCISFQLNRLFDPLFSPLLSAYRQRYNCEAVLLRLVEDFRSALDKRLVAGIVGLDLSKAFDIVPHNLLLAKLSAYGLDASSINLLNNYLSGRYQRVALSDNVSEWKQVFNGVPQGSVLGPVLFNIFINDLFYFIQNCKISNFADDNQIYKTGPAASDVNDALNAEIITADLWFKNNLLSVNQSKRESMFISKSDSTYLDLKMDQIEIPPVPKLQLLGVVIDSKLKFSDQVAKVCRKVSKQLAVLGRFKNILPTHIKLLIYKKLMFFPISFIAHLYGIFVQRWIVVN